MADINLTTPVADAAKDTVLSFLQALNKEDYETARTLASEELAFIGVLGTRNGADAYFNDMKRMKFHYDVMKVFTDEEDVCVFYDVYMNEMPVPAFGWYHVENEKINMIRVIFDPRPVLEAAAKK
ncbi:nuclear transport factor 2 family protein [Deminuibacter soli]|uniref:Nuclear transport factor 2 family protein n=1 Tax=Deminuibacter soli TaxID=2291815 RepID=A0A3E1NQ97_9BACT|nr:nuclear transport factor 2 family protein [Deminuibacter soli]RFM30090.1 nuclear transport factor 2 family protein [Deminuibacter soli]